MFKIDIDAEGIQRAASSIAHIPGAIIKARKFALNKAEQAMKTAAIEETTAKYYVKASDLRRSITYSRKNGSLQMKVRGTRHTLAAYKLTPLRPGKRRYHLYGAVKREGGLKPLGSNSFLMKSGGKHPYIPMQRTTLRSYPIRSVIAPAYPQIIGNDDTVEKIREEALIAMEKEFKRQALRSLGVLR